MNRELDDNIISYETLSGNVLDEGWCFVTCWSCDNQFDLRDLDVENLKGLNGVICPYCGESN